MKVSVVTVVRTVKKLALQGLNSRLGLAFRYVLVPSLHKACIREAMLHPLTVTALELKGFGKPRLELETRAGVRHLLATGGAAFKLHAEIHARITWVALQADEARREPGIFESRVRKAGVQRSIRPRLAPARVLGLADASAWDHESVRRNG